MNGLIIRERKRTIINIIFTLLGLLINYGINFYLTPYILQHLGSEAYGFSSLANTMVNYLLIITSALNSYACYSISFNYHNKDYARANGFFSSLFVANAILSFAICAIGFYFIYKIEYILHISDWLLGDVKIVFAMVLVNYSISLLGASFSFSTFIQNRLDLSSLCSICGYFINAIGIVTLFLLFRPRIWYMALIAIMVSLFMIACNTFFAKKFTPELKIRKKFLSFSYIKELIQLGVWSSIGRMGLILSDGLDLLITNLLMDGTTMGQVTLAKTIPTMTYNIIYQITVTFQPNQVKLWAENRKDALISNLKSTMIFTGIVSNIIFCGFYSSGKDFFELWIPSENVPFIYELTIFGMVGNILVAVVYPLVYTNALSKRVKGPCIVNLISGFLNVFLMYFLLSSTQWGAYIIVGTSAFLSVLVHFIYVPIHSAMNLKVNWHIFYFTILKSLITGCITLICFNFLGNIIVVEKWSHLLFKIICLTIIGIVLNFNILVSKQDKTKFVSYAIQKLTGKG